jgi:hypothetical protein
MAQHYGQQPERLPAKAAPHGQINYVPTLGIEQDGRRHPACSVLGWEDPLVEPIT